MKRFSDDDLILFRYGESPEPEAVREALAADRALAARYAELERLLSTVDLATPDGDSIPIEERDQREITHLGSSRLTPEGAHIRNPAFDVTPHRYISGIITEKGIFGPPYHETLKAAFEAATRS